MKPKLVALNLILAAGIGVVCWQFRVRMAEAEKVRQANLSVRVRTATPPPAIPAPKPEAAPAIRYEDVAKKNLFAKDRTPDVIIDPPKKVEEKKMPPLPVVYGVMGLPSGVKAIMSEHPNEASRPIHAGDSIGDFKVLALDIQKVTFEWNGQVIERRIEDLIDRSQPVPGGAPRENSGPAAPPPATAQTQLRGPAAPAAAAVPLSMPKDATPNADGTFTVTDPQGNHQVYRNTPFGPMKAGTAQ